MPDERGYPTEFELARIKQWSDTDLYGLVKFARSIWWQAEWGWGSQPNPNNAKITHTVSTGGWSGNEEIIRALQAHPTFWMFCWVSARRGGHYVFEVKGPRGIQEQKAEEEGEPGE